MTKIHVAPPISILPKDFQRFIKQFARGVPVERLSLCRDLRTKWTRWNQNPAAIAKCYEANLPSAKNLRECVGKQKVVGVYCIYAKQEGKAFECFYVGISNSSIYDRLNQHLCGDIRHKNSYDRGKRDAYVWLGNAVEVVICYATIQHDKEVVGARASTIGGLLDGSAPTTVLMRVHPRARGSCP